MFSSSVAGGSICLGCQLRAVTRRAAAPILSTAAHTRIRSRRRRYYASKAAKELQDDFAAILEGQRHTEPRKSREQIPADDWGLSEDTIQNATVGAGKNGNEGQVKSNGSIHIAHDQAEPVRQDDFIRKTLGGQAESNKPSHTALDQAEPVRRDDFLNQATEGQVKSNALDHIAHDQGVPWWRANDPVQKEPLRSYWKGDTKLVQDFRELSVDSLGRKADIIVLKEGGKFKRKPPPKAEKDSASGSTDFEEFVDQEPGLSLDTVMENIEEFRPQHRILPAREFKVVFDSLMKSFTSPQIAEYVTRYHERLEQGEELVQSGTLPGSGTPRPWIVSEMRWIPDVQGAVPHLGHSLQGYILKSMPPKQRRVMQVMRECWGMSVQELTHGLGALEVEVRDLEFKLLTLGNQRWLQQITRIYLGQGKGKSVSIIKSRKVLRIEAPKAIAESCLDALDKTLEKIRTKTFSMDKTTFANLNPGVVEELGQLTNSVLSLDSTRNEIQVTWIDYQNRSTSQLEDLGDTVFRLLLTGNTSSKVENSLNIYPFVQEKARLVEDLTSKERLPWIHRRMRWARVCLPASSPSTLVDETWSTRDEILKYKVVPLPQDFEEQLDDAMMNAFKDIEMESVSEIVERRKGAHVSPLAIPRASSETGWPEDRQEEQQQLKASEEYQTSPEPTAQVNERLGPQEFQERIENERSQAPDKHQTSLEPDLPEGKQEKFSESQVSEEPLMSEGLQFSSEQEASETEQAKLQNFETTEELKVSEEIQTAVNSDTSAGKLLEHGEIVVPGTLERQQTPSIAAAALTPRWSPFRVRTNAVFGHVLHLFEPNWPYSADKAVTTIKALANSPRVISPLIPPITKMDLKGWVPYNSPSNMTSMVVMRFVPSNDTNTSAQQTNPAPLLELRMQASDEDIIAIDSLRAVARTQVSDILFPSEVVDVRTTQRLEAELSGSMVDVADGMAPLITFLTSSYLQIREGKLLTPPSITDLGLPEWMFQDHYHEFVSHKKSLAGYESIKPNDNEKREGQNRKKKAKHGDNEKEKKTKLSREGGGEEDTPLRPTSYVFAGLEVHRTLETTYDGWKLAYTSIEAGQGGGRRAELSLEARPGYDRDLRRTEDQINAQEFLQSVYTLARGLPGGLVKTRAPHGHKVRTTIEWFGAAKKAV